jgi:predicted dehydrogenase
MKPEEFLQSSRRKFLKNLTWATGSGLWLPSALSACAANNQENKGDAGQASPKKDRLGVALIGLGNYSNGQLAPALSETSKCYLAGIVTGTPSKAEEWKAKYNIPEKNIYNYDNFDQIANNPDIDFVYVVLPNSMHAEYVMRAAKAKKHVMCEKPMAINANECRQMIAACKENGVKLGVGYRLHFEPYNKEMMRLAKEEVYGKVTDVETSFGFTIGDPTQWRLKKALAGGGPLMDVGIYTIQGACYTYGEDPIAVMATEMAKTDLTKFADVEEALEFTLKFPSGRTSRHFTSYNQNMNFLKAKAEKGWFELTRAYDYGPLSGQTSEGAMNFPQIREQTLHLDYFAECVQTGKDPMTSGEMGLRDMKIIDAIFASASSKKEVSIV